tara:strand:- start:1266 stop:1406 length:141 start_codon:yes stop_codon:yes gene_type:complete
MGNVKKIKTHKDVQLPFGSGKTDTRPYVARPPVKKASSRKVNSVNA